MTFPPPPPTPPPPAPPQWAPQAPSAAPPPRQSSKLVPLLIVGAIAVVTLIAGAAAAVMIVMMNRGPASPVAPADATPPTEAVAEPTPAPPPPASVAPETPVAEAERAPEPVAPPTAERPRARAREAPRERPAAPIREATEERARPTSAREEPAAEPVERTLRVGGAIPQPRKIRNVRPVYPQIAQSARVQGIVIIEATIDTRGHISDTRVLRSIPLLDQAALDAVRQWEYEPTLVNGVPVPVIVTVTVNFALQP